jgi:hypothetical protein
MLRERQVFISPATEYPSNDRIRSLRRASSWVYEEKNWLLEKMFSRHRHDIDAYNMSDLESRFGIIASIQ